MAREAQDTGTQDRDNRGTRHRDKETENGARGTDGKSRVMGDTRVTRVTGVTGMTGETKATRVTSVTIGIGLTKMTRLPEMKKKIHTIYHYYF